MMMNFDTDLDRLRVSRRVVTTTVLVPNAVMTITEGDHAPVTVPVEPIAPTALMPVVVTEIVIPSRSDLWSESKAWTWDQLRDYIVNQIVSHHGPFPRDAIKESAICKGFISRWGLQAGPIAVSAFESYGGYWRSAPIAITRFAKNSDPFFAEVIAAKLQH